MPGKTPPEAFSAFVDPLAEALKCIAVTKYRPSPGGQAVVDVEHSLQLTGDHENEYTRLKGLAVVGDRTTRLEFMARMRYKIIEDARPDYGRFRVTTRAYDYALQTADKSLVVAYHWHPSGSSHEVRPHLHLGSTQLTKDSVLTKKQHILTGRITLENAIETAIQLGAEPRFPDWREILEMCERPHLQWRTWNHDYELETGEKIKG